MSSLLLIILSYFYGSLPFGVFIGKKLKGIDIREFGSGNIGAANAFRTLGPAGGIAVLLCDMSKGILPVLLARFFAASDALVPLLQVIAGVTAILGHNYSIFLKFKGGKGIATSFGVIIALNWWIALMCFSVWGLMVLLTRYSSVGSLSGSLALPAFMVIFKQPVPFIAFGIISCAFAFYAHRGNIKKLLKGTELKITEKAGKEDAPREESDARAS
ncbi:MAG: glycerol-3-phosphate 1-O-acyltransferase PlsY [Candidatus Eremiobacteraeota bacterium]|nr:glycerol-3-phosphate 1-O-acyltransferase PlsY [Candidatus Eremiobacteraeota bacterium]